MENMDLSNKAHFIGLGMQIFTDFRRELKSKTDIFIIEPSMSTKIELFRLLLFDALQNRLDIFTSPANGIHSLSQHNRRSSAFDVHSIMSIHRIGCISYLISLTLAIFLIYIEQLNFDNKRNVCKTNMRLPNFTSIVQHKHELHIGIGIGAGVRWNDYNCDFSLEEWNGGVSRKNTTN